MSLSSAMHAAMSGLNAVSRATGLVSENVANAATPGYGRRTLSLSAAGGGIAGVRVWGVERHVDPVLISYRRAADADLSHADARVAFYSRLNGLTGAADDPFSISARIAGFEASLLSAASRPDLGDRLDDAARKAGELAGSLRTASAGVQQARRDADATIGLMVEDLNTALSQLQDLNAQISRSLGSGAGTAGLEDQRQSLIDDINALVPVTVVDRPRGQVALYSRGGAILLDGVAADIGFTASGSFGPAQTLENGGLGGLTVNGLTVKTGTETGALRGGRLGAQFAVRDEWAVTAQADLDAVARNLIERFQDPAVDPTLGSADAGLFTDAGGAFDAIDETGISARIQLNAAADPDAGGDSWRLRDGLLATGPGAPGNTTLLAALRGALTATRTVVGGRFGTADLTASGLGAALAARVDRGLATAESRQARAAATQSELLQQEQAAGVDSDAEMQSLLELEQAYTANAKVIAAVDQMLSEILRI